MTYREKIAFLEKAKVAEPTEEVKEALKNMGVKEDAYSLANLIIESIIEDLHRLESLETNRGNHE